MISRVNDWLDHRGSLILGLALILVTGFVAYGAVTNSSTDSRQDSSLLAVNCAQANLVSLSADRRQRLVNEPLAHYQSRLRAQRAMLLLSVGLDCEDDFPGLALTRANALRQIDHSLSFAADPSS